MEDQVRDPGRNKRAVRAADPNVTEQSTGGESQPQRWYVSQDSIHNVTTKSGYLNSRQVPYFCSLF